MHREGVYDQCGSLVLVIVCICMCGEKFTTALRREIPPKWFAARYFLDGSGELLWEELSPGTSQSARYSGFQKVEKVARKLPFRTPW